MMRLGLLVLLLTIASFEVMASCHFGVPKEQIAPIDELIGRTKNIVLARVIKAEYIEPKKIDANNEEEQLQYLVDIVDGTYRPIKYTFEVIDLIKGNSQKFFTMEAEMLSRTYDLEHFNSHKDEKFWANDVGRSYPCEVDKVSFSIGSVYLMFLDKPYHRKSFERIPNYQSDDHKDKWLGYVQNKIVDQK